MNGQVMRLDALAAFSEVVRLGGFSAAARSLGRSRQAVHREVSQLEEDVGVRLLERSSRSVRTTDAGRRLFGYAEQMLTAARRATEEMEKTRRGPTGTLRVTSPQLLGEELLAPIVVEFIQRWPEVQIDLEHSLEREDLVASDFDVAVRVGPLDDTNLYARLLATSGTAFVASPAYLEKHDAPLSVERLLEHPLLHYGRRRRGEAVSWPIEGRSVRVNPRYCSSSARNVLIAALSGAGIAHLPRLVCGPALENGDLLEVLPGSASEDIPIHAVYGHQRRGDPTLDAFIDALEKGLGATLPMAALAPRARLHPRLF